MNRAERRRIARSAKKFDQRNSFTREEVEKANASAYEYGKQLALKAAKKVLKLGDTRLNRIEEELKRQEYETFVKPFEDMEGVSSNEK